MAEFCIAPVLRSVASRSVLAVGGPEALSPLDVVRIFEEESGGRFEIESIPEEKLREQLDSANDSLEKSFAGIMLQYAQGDARQTLCRPLFWYMELGKEPLRGISSFQSFRVPGTK